jgi:hypothetical protein
LSFYLIFRHENFEICRRSYTQKRLVVKL